MTPPTVPRGTAWTARLDVDPAVVEAFDALAERLAKPESWIKRVFARTSRRGRDVPTESDKARCWCLQGAIWSLPLAAQTPIYTALIRVIPAQKADLNPVTVWNDARGRTHAEVLYVIAQAKAAYIDGQILATEATS